MPDIWMDVDAALSEVPVNIFPLTDDTDFKSIEGAVAYNAAGMALRWHFVTCAGAYSVTSVTPTTGGNYDWTDQGDSGIYTIEIPASGGASINNDTEGFGWFTGSATGILPWRGPVIGFRRAALNDLLIEGGTASTNLEDFFDGTGYAGGTATLNVNVATIANGAITAAAVATGAIDADAIADNAIDAGAIASDAITAAKIATGAITNAKFAAGAIDAAAIANNAIDAATFAADVDAEIAAMVWNAATASYGTAGTYGALLESGNVGGGAIVAASVTGAVGSVTGLTNATIADAVWDEASTGHTDAGKAGQQLWTDVDAILADTGTDGVVVASIANNAITAAAIATGAIDADAIADNAIDAGAIASDAITAAKIATGAITNAKFAAGAIDAAAIANGAIDAATFAADVDAEIATMVWNAATASYGGAGTYGQAVEDTLADTNELQGDWANGGRLDLIVDGILEDTGTTLPGTLTTIAGYVDTEVAAILAAVDTEVAGIVSTLGVAGAGLTAVPWNAAWDAEVQSECADAITAASLPSASSIADAVWDEVSTGHVDAGKAGAQLWTDLDAVLADTDEIQAELADGGRTDLLIDGIKTKTDSLTFTVAGNVDANVQRINDVAVAGDGSATPWGPA